MKSLDRGIRWVGFTAAAVILFTSSAAAQLLRQSKPQINQQNPNAVELLPAMPPAPTVTLNGRPNAQDDAVLSVLRQQSQSIAAVAMTVPTLQPEHTMGVTPAQMGRLTSPKSGALHCPAPSIAAVDRKPAGIDFSPIEPYNRYVIQGCFSGEIPKAVYLLAAQSFFPKSSGKMPFTAPMPIKLGTPTCNLAASNRMDLVVDFPGPNPYQHKSPADPHQQIDVHVPPCISGVIDQMGNSVTLVVEYANGTKAQRSGFNFFAARDTTYLKTIPKSALTLAPNVLFPVNNDGTSPFKYVSPVSNYSAIVIRHSPTLRFPIGTDTFNLNGLQLGFAVLKAEFYPRSLTQQMCQAALRVTNAQVQTQGNWGVQWGNDPMVLVVSRRLSFCQSATLFNTPSGTPALFDETYAIKVPVKGPRGVPPWPDGSY